ncbi:putative phospholipase [Helianthus annuus]|nr:putative phospholipase [Helianthus annuus]KAJ0595478.1 putative phospholipase [Helianthus annuus]KAJ0756160.1 putative phospholipase [Helianthus annuus]KAJ0759936.1 putative phospholipase [Helianthus annuus]KAJ0929645.1 putative phospholipase [Helianthus annuus]
MVKSTEEDASDTPIEKELYFRAEVKIRCRIGVATEIRDRLRPGSVRSELFRGTCFGPWLDIRSTSIDSNLLHLILQTEYTPVVHQDALFFRVGGQELRFGPQEFCLITGMRFGPHQLWRQNRMHVGLDMTFRGRVFGHVRARVQVSDLKNVFDSSLDQLSDLDAVRLCLLMLLEIGFMGSRSASFIHSDVLELVEDLDSWNTFPWGSYVWKVVYRQLHNALPKRSARRAFSPQLHNVLPKRSARRFSPLNYSLEGFIWAFKIWIFEVFPYSEKFAIKHGGIPRAISWGKNKCISWKHALPFVVDATVPGFEPLPVLTPTLEECATDWWRASCQFFDGYFSPLLKKARLSSPPQPSVMVRDQLVDNNSNTTTMLVEDNTDNTSNITTTHQGTGWRENMEKTMLVNKLQKPSVIKRLTSLDTHADELYSAKVKIRCHIAVATEIRDRLGPGSARSELFRSTCFGPWLDIQSLSIDSPLVHLILQTEYTPTPVVHQDALFFRVRGQDLRFGPQEFCIITGLRFGPQNWIYRSTDMTFRERVFGHVEARPKVSDLKNVFTRSLDRLSDLDAVRICLLLLVEFGFMPCDPRALVHLNLLELVEDLDSWNTFPWGSYVWKSLYKQLHNTPAKRSARRHYTLGYSLSGLIWAFKIWIFEVFPYAKRFAIKNGGIPRAISWGKNKCITWKLALPFVTDAAVPGFEPLPVLTPTPEECATDWWRASCQFFDSYANDSSPLLKKARLSPPPQPSVMVPDQLAEDIADPADMPSSDNTTGHQSTGSRTNMEKTTDKLQKPLVLTHRTSLEERVDELLKAKRPLCLKTEMPTTSDLFGPFDHVEDRVVVGKVSSESDIICVQGYNVKQSVAPILESIFKKHGDIAADCLFKPASMRSSFLEIVCEAVSRIQTNDDIEEIEQQVVVAEAANINVSWLRVHLDTIRARRKCSLLMETKANTSLVKRAALMDLRESCVELMAAQERFEKAERCVRVLNLVENNINDNILES